MLKEVCRRKFVANIKNNNYAFKQLRGEINGS